MGGATRSSRVHWISTTPSRAAPTVWESFGGLVGVPNRADADRVGLTPEGVTFEREGMAVTIAWSDLLPSETRRGKGMLVLSARPAASQEPGSWTEDAAQAKAILTDPEWRDPAFSREFISNWLS
ncbi:MAG: hypothetical protein ACRECT_01810 [Thermoplasmata archaeon]